MAKANLPPIKIPTSLLTNATERVYFEAINFAIYQLFKRSGGGDDFFTDVLLRLDALELDVATLQLQVAQLIIDVDALEVAVAAILVRLDAIDLSIVDIENRLDAVEARLDYLEGEIIVTIVGVTTDGNQTIICNSDLTVTLDLNPLDKDIVKVKAVNAKIIIDSNGRAIDGSDTVTMRKGYINLSMVYSSAEDAWFII